MRVLLATSRTNDLTHQQIAKDFISGWESLSSNDSFSTRIFSDDIDDPQVCAALEKKNITIWKAPSMGEDTLNLIENWGKYCFGCTNFLPPSKGTQKIWVEGIKPSLIPGYPNMSEDQIEDLFIQLILSPLAFLNGYCQKNGGHFLDLPIMSKKLQAYLQAEEKNEADHLTDFWESITYFRDLNRSVLERIRKGSAVILLAENNVDIDLTKLWPMLEKHPAADTFFHLYEKIQGLFKIRADRTRLPVLSQNLGQNFAQNRTDSYFTLPAKEISGWGIARLLTNLGLNLSALKTEICEEIDNLLNTDNLPDLIVCNTDSFGIWDYSHSLLEELVNLAGKYHVPVIIWGNDLEFSRRDMLEMGFAGIYKLGSGKQRFREAGIRSAATWGQKAVS